MTEGRPGSLAAAASGADRFLGWLILLAGLLLVAGWTLPIMTVHRLLVLSDQVSVAESVWALWHDGSYFLCALIVLFSIVLPLLKITMALYLWYGAETRDPSLAQALGWMERIGRWSMLDVFVVAVGVVAVKLSLVSDVAVHAGIYLLFAGIVLSIVVVRRVAFLAARSAGGLGPA